MLRLCFILLSNEVCCEKVWNVNDILSGKGSFLFKVDVI